MKKILITCLCITALSKANIELPINQTAFLATKTLFYTIPLAHQTQLIILKKPTLIFEATKTLYMHIKNPQKFNKHRHIISCKDTPVQKRR